MCFQCPSRREIARRNRDFQAPGKVTLLLPGLVAKAFCGRKVLRVPACTQGRAPAALRHAGAGVASGDKVRAGWFPKVFPKASRPRRYYQYEVLDEVVGVLRCPKPSVSRLCRSPGRGSSGPWARG